MKHNILKDYVKDFRKAHIAVVGDMVVDIYLYGKPYRLSREAPVVVMRYQSEQVLPGSAANTVNNLSKLGAQVYPVGVVGDDKAGRDLLSYFKKEKNIDTAGIFSVASRGTFTKTRVLAGDSHVSKQQVVRIDRDDCINLSSDTEARLLSYIEQLSTRVDAFIVSDYGYDLMTKALVERICALAKEKIVVVDSRDRLREFKGVTLLTPNEQEVGEFLGRRIDSEGDVVEAGRKIMTEVKPRHLIITRGNEGMLCFQDRDEVKKIPICGSDEVTDVTGAGDTVAGVITLGLVGGATPYEAACLANYAAGIVVMKRGTATVTAEELMEVIQGDRNENS